MVTTDKKQNEMKIILTRIFILNCLRTVKKSCANCCYLLIRLIAVFENETISAMHISQTKSRRLLGTIALTRIFHTHPRLARTASERESRIAHELTSAIGSRFARQFVRAPAQDLWLIADRCIGLPVTVLGA